MAKDAITMFKEAAAQLQREEAYLALEGTRKKNDEDEALQQLIGDFNLARIDLNSELSKSADKDQDKVNELNVKVNQLYNDIMANESMAAYNEAKAELESVMNCKRHHQHGCQRRRPADGGGAAAGRMLGQLRFLFGLPLMAAPRSARFES